MGWFKLGKKVNKYVETAAQVKFDEHADPKVQLEQALVEAQEQDARLREQAAHVIANQKQAEMRLHRAMDQLDKVKTQAGQALRMADAATDETKRGQYTAAATAYANQLIALEQTVAEDRQMVEATTTAAGKAHAAVQDNAQALQKKLAERQKLLSQLDQAKMQEAMNATLDQIGTTLSQDVPTLDAVREKIEARYANALGVESINDDAPDHAMLEIEHAAADAAAQDRLAALRDQLGLGAGPSASTPAAVSTNDASVGQLA